MSEKRYTLTRCENHPEHFFIVAQGEDGDHGASKQIFDEALGRAVDDLEQQNHCMEETHGKAEPIGS